MLLSLSILCIISTSLVHSSAVLAKNNNVVVPKNFGTVQGRFKESSGENLLKPTPNSSKIKLHRKCRQLQPNFGDEQLKSVDELREEVTKLRKLVQILRDQQYLLTLLNDVGDFESKGRQIHNNKIAKDKDEIPELKDEIQDLKEYIQKLVTKKSNEGDDVEKKLEDQIENQKDEIRTLKGMLLKYINSSDNPKSRNRNTFHAQNQLPELHENYHKRINDENRKDLKQAKNEKLSNQRQLLNKLEKELEDLKKTLMESQDREKANPDTDVLLQSPLFFRTPNIVNRIPNPSIAPTPTPTPIMQQQFSRARTAQDPVVVNQNLDLLENQLKQLEKQQKTPFGKAQQRDSSSDLKKLLKSLDNDDDVEDIVDEFKKHVTKKKRKENQEQIRKIIQSLGNENDLQSKTDDDSDNQLFKFLEKLLDKNAAQSKNLEEGNDVEEELKSLEKAIVDLQPKDDLDLMDDRGGELSLSKLFSLPSIKKPIVNAQKIANIKKQIFQLKKQYGSHGGSDNGGNYGIAFGNGAYGGGAGAGIPYGTGNSHPGPYGSGASYGSDKLNGFGGPNPYSSFGGGNSYGSAHSYLGGNSAGGAYPGGNLYSGAASNYPGANLYAAASGYPETNLNSGGNLYSGSGASTSYSAPNANMYSGGNLYPPGNVYPNGGSSYSGTNSYFGGSGSYPYSPGIGNNNNANSYGSANSYAGNVPYSPTGYSNRYPALGPYLSSLLSSGYLDKIYSGGYSNNKGPTSGGYKNHPVISKPTKYNGAYQNQDVINTYPHSSNQYPPQVPQHTNGHDQYSASLAQSSYMNQFFHVPPQHPPGYQQSYRQIYSASEAPLPANQPQPYEHQAQNINVDEAYTHQKAEDLKNQIDSLQGVINNLNRPEYTQKPEDKQTVYDLESQINELKHVITNLNQPPAYNQAEIAPHYQDGGNYAPQPNPNSSDGANYGANPNDAHGSNSPYSPPPSPSNGPGPSYGLIDNHPNPPEPIPNYQPGVPDQPAADAAPIRYKRSDQTVAEVEEDSTLNTVASFLEKHLFKEADDSEEKVESEPISDLEKNKKDLNDKLKELKEQLESKLHVPAPPPQQLLQTLPLLTPQLPKLSQPRFGEPGYGSYNYGPPNYNYGNPYYQPPFDFKKKDKDLSKSSKKDDLFDKFVGKIIDKIIRKVTIAVPKVIEALFGFGLKGAGYGDYGVGAGHHFGLLGFIPALITKIFSGISSFIYKIQKNKFLKSFLVPILIIGLVAGAVIFLVWWLQPYEHDYGISYNNNNNYDYPGHNSYDVYKTSASNIDLHRNNNNQNYYNQYDHNNNMKSVANRDYHDVMLNNHLSYPHDFHDSLM